MGRKFLKDSQYGSLNQVEDTLDINGCVETRRSIAQDYLDGRINLHIHVRFDDEEYCAIFDRDTKIACSDRAVKQAQEDCVSQRESGEQQVSVLIGITQLMEVPEVPRNSFRHITKLKRINDWNYCVGHPLELTPLIMFVFGGITENRELVVDGGCSSLGQNELTNKVVEGTSEIIEHFSDAQAEVLRYGGHIAEAVDLISRCIIDVFGDNIGFEVTEGNHVSAQCLTLLLGPVEFCIRTLKGGHNDTLQKGSKNSKGTRDSRAHKRRVSFAKRGNALI